MQLHHAFLDAVPVDPDPRNVSRQVFGACASLVAPTPVAAPRLIAWVPELAEELGLDVEAEVDVLAGNRVPEGARPWAACYGGHQFGTWAGQLGDGRAIVLGERVTPAGSFELQLKGAGPTPYARRADGRAVLRSSIREFLCSEAMFHLGVPTTRALSLVATGETVLRDMFYDGRARHEPGAVVCRVAPHFLRFGSLQIHASRGDVDTLSRLVDHLLGAPWTVDALLAWFLDVADRTVRLVADWQRVGFVHGVLNTDNLSTLGLTIDYGPYGWLERYDLGWTPNTTDAGVGRYAYGQQPHVIAWNLARLAEALIPLVGEVPPVQAALDTALAGLRPALRGGARRKLGLVSEQEGDDALVDALPRLLVDVGADWTRFHRRLGALVPDDDDARRVAPLLPALYETPTDRAVHGLAAWTRRWLARVAVDHPDPAERKRSMDAVNPRIVLRNWIVQQVIDEAEAGDASGVTRLLEAFRRPYDDADDALDAMMPLWAADRAGCSMLSCSS